MILKCLKLESSFIMINEKTLINMCLGAFFKLNIVELWHFSISALMSEKRSPTDFICCLFVLRHIIYEEQLA